MVDTCPRCGEDKNGYRSAYCGPCWREMERNRRQGRPAMAPPPEKQCGQCGRLFSPSRYRRVQFCSQECRAAAIVDRNRVARQAAKAAALRDRKCLHCGDPIAPDIRREARFCSPECNSRAHQLKRKLRADGYLRAQIADREGWRCGICRKKVDPALKHPDPGFGSLDHVVPKARGGSHDPSNLRLVHLVCNLRRRATFDAAELALGPRAVREIQQLSLFEFEEDAQPV